MTTVGSATSKDISASLAGVWGRGRGEGILRGLSGNGGFKVSSLLVLVLGLGEVGGVVRDERCLRDWTGVTMNSSGPSKSSDFSGT